MDINKWFQHSAWQKPLLANQWKKQPKGHRQWQEVFQHSALCTWCTVLSWAGLDRVFYYLHLGLPVSTYCFEPITSHRGPTGHVVRLFTIHELSDYGSRNKTVHNVSEVLAINIFFRYRTGPGLGSGPVRSTAGPDRSRKLFWTAPVHEHMQYRPWSRAVRNLIC